MMSEAAEQCNPHLVSFRTKHCTRCRLVATLRGCWQMADTYLTPEAKARRDIDVALKAAGWIVQSVKDLNLAAGPGQAGRGYQAGSDATAKAAGAAAAGRQRAVACSGTGGQELRGIAGEGSTASAGPDGHR